MKRFDTRHRAGRVPGLFLALVLGLAIAAASPAGTAATSDTHYPKVLRDMVDAGKIQVVSQFATDKPGLTGYIVKRNGYQTVVYSEDGYLMLGPLYGPQGRNLSRQYARKHTPKPDVARIIDGLDRQHVITEGPADAPTLYAFLDPNCIFCHKLYQQMKPLVQAGTLQVHWIMVGVLGPSSVGRAATILKATDPAAALARNEAGFDVATEQGGVATTSPDESLSQLLKTNRQAMFAVGSNGTPTVLFRDADGHWQARQGLPPSGWLTHYARKKTP